MSRKATVAKGPRKWVYVLCCTTCKCPLEDGFYCAKCGWCYFSGQGMYLRPSCPEHRTALRRPRGYKKGGSLRCPICRKLYTTPKKSKKS
ncbi:MAG: hypothetical protein V1723_02260 [Candidatus Uhrbacteria bacterium]